MLSSTKVLDLSRVLAGPICTMMLGDLGADVLKVERPGGGDDTRAWGPPFDETGQSAYFLSVNRNKLSVTLDLDLDSDLTLLQALAAEADVVVENFRPGTLERRGWGAASCLSECPGLIWCTISGFGADSPRPGYDLVIQAESGWMSITGEPDGEPLKHGVALADVLAGKDATVAILAALLARAGTGRGRHLEISLKESAEAALINVAQNTLVSGNAPARWGNAHPNLVPYQSFLALDRSLVIAVGNDAQWRACTRALGLSELEADLALSTNAGRVANRSRVLAPLFARLSTANAVHWCALLEAEGVPCGLVRSVPEVLAQIAASARTGLPPSVPGTVRHPPPTLGQHSAIVRREGWNAFSRLSDASR